MDWPQKAQKAQTKRVDPSCAFALFCGYISSAARPR
jgi:hypothetical protein